MRSEARLVPFEPAGRHEPPRVRLGVRYQSLVLRLDEPIRRQRLSPMGHQPLVLGDVADKIAAVRGEAVWNPEIRGEDGESDIDRVAPAMDEGGVGEDPVDDTKRLEL
jgi:hypothetical protein